MLDIEKIRQIREQTGMSIGNIKKALDESNGNIDKALAILKEKGVQISQKKKERTASDGIIEFYIHSNGKIGSMVEVSCETDFVSRSAEFKEFAHDIAMQIAAAADDLKDNDVAALMLQNFIKNETETIKDILERKVSKFGEKIEIKRFIRFKVGE